jgi:hypothetical protein
MDLHDQVALIREHWLLLADASRKASIPEHTYLNALAALMAKELGRQPEHVATEWIAVLEDHVLQLRARGAVEGSR